MGPSYPINFIQIIARQRNRADNTHSRGRLHGNRDSAVKDVEVRLNSWSLVSSRNCEVGPITRVLEISAIRYHPTAISTLGKIRNMRGRLA